MKLRRVIIVGALAWLGGVSAAVAGGASAPADGSPYRTVRWSELVPAGWDPAKVFQDMNIAALSDADPRAGTMLSKMREVWDKAPTNPALHGQALRIPGFVVPLEESKAGIKEFLLVPYFGACIHSPPPPANQIVHVRSARPVKGLKSMDTVWVNGKMTITSTDTYMGVSGYRMNAVEVSPYTRKTQ